MNSEAVKVETGLAGECVSGIMIGDDGVVRALWMALMHVNEEEVDIYRFYGISTSAILPVISRIQEGEILGVEFEVITMNNKDESRTLLKGDIVLTLNDKIITQLSETDIQNDNEVLKARVVRSGGELDLEFDTVLADDLETKRVVLFSGATLQNPQFAAKFRFWKSPIEIFVSSVVRGSPAAHYGLTQATFITHVKDTEAGNLNSFLEAAMAILDDTNFTLTTKTLSGIEQVMKMKRTDHYFPWKEWIRASPKWISQRV